MARTTVAGALLPALTFPVLIATASFASPIPLLVPQPTAFAVLGHSCGGIQEQAFATGFDATSGYPVGDVYLQTRCGGSGRGGGYHTTTYSAWVAVVWSFDGGAISYARVAAPPSDVDPTFSATDAHGNALRNTLSAINVQPSRCTVGNTTYCTYRADLTLAPDFVPAPVVTGVSPSIGPASGGTTVTITGTDLGGATAVDFGGVAAASFVVDAEGSITAVSPAAPAAAVDVTVTTAGGTSAPTPSAGFTFAAAPSVSGLVPSSGPIGGGTEVVIAGANLAGATAVRFGEDAVAFTVDDDTSITAISPAVESADTAHVTVTTPGGTSAPTAEDLFTFTDVPACSGACIAIADATTIEGNAGSHRIAFAVTLSGPSATTVSVPYAVESGTATGGPKRGVGVDFKLKTGTLTFLPGIVKRHVRVRVFGDTLPEADETFTVTLSNPTGGYAIGRGVATGTILNDDGPP